MAVRTSHQHQIKKIRRILTMQHDQYLNGRDLKQGDSQNQTLKPQK